MASTTPRLAWSLTAALVLCAGLAARADSTGTLDRLVGQVDVRFGVATTKQPAAKQDLALSVRRGAGDVPARLVGAVRDLLLGKLTARGYRSVAAVSPTGTAGQRQKRARAGGFERLLDLEVTIHEGYLHLQGNVAATDRHLWRDLVQPSRGILSHLHASVRVDAEVRAFSGSVKARALRYTPRRHALGAGEVLALDAADLDGDGGVELVVLRNRDVAVLRLRKGKLERVARAEMTAPAAALRPRRSLGTLALADTDKDGHPEILARTSVLQQGAHLALSGKDLVSKGALAGYPLMAGPGKAHTLAEAEPGRDLLNGARLATALTAASAQKKGASQPKSDASQPRKVAPRPKKAPTPPPKLPATFYSFKAVEVSLQKGGTRRHLGLVDGAGRLHLHADRLATPILVQPGAGVAFDLADLDDDGTLELVTTGADAPSSADDRIFVRRLLGKRLSPVLWRSRRLGGLVTAVTHGDLNGDGKLELVAAVLGRTGKTTLVVLD